MKMLWRVAIMLSMIVCLPVLADLDSDGDGLPDNWEAQYGLDPSDPSDGLVQAVLYNAETITNESRGVGAYGVIGLDNGREFSFNGYALWKAVPVGALNIVPDTCLQFRYCRSGNMLEIQGIGFSLSAYQPEESFFSVAGTSAFGIGDYRQYTGDDWTFFHIPVGKHFDGSFRYVTLANFSTVSLYSLCAFSDIRIGRDKDGDGILNADEYELGLNPSTPDSDGDGMPDGWEFQFGLNPAIPDGASDADGDGVSNSDEYTNRTHPNVPTRYVSPFGNDAAPGTRQEPWKTLSRAASSLARGGCMVLLEGLYTNESLNLGGSISGFPEAPTKVVAEGTVSLFQFSVAGSLDYPLHHVQVEGLTLTNKTSGVAFSAQYMRNCRFAGNVCRLDGRLAPNSSVRGLYLNQCHDSVIEGNACSGSRTFATYDNQKSAHGLHMEYCHRNRILNNTCSSNYSEHYRGEACGIVLVGSHDNELRDNRCEGNNQTGGGYGDNPLGGMGIQINSSHRNTVEENVTAANKSHGVYLGSCTETVLRANDLQDGCALHASPGTLAQNNFLAKIDITKGGGITAIHIRNNVFYTPSWSIGDAAFIHYSDADRAQPFVILNNIFDAKYSASIKGVYFANTTGAIELDYNCVSLRLQGLGAEALQGAHNIVAEPGFADIEQGDALLAADSPCRFAGYRHANMGMYLPADREAETDGDGIPDHEEALISFTDPTLFDTDGDGFGDGTKSIPCGHLDMQYWTRNGQSVRDTANQFRMWVERNYARVSFPVDLGYGGSGCLLSDIRPEDMPASGAASYLYIYVAKESAADLEPRPGRYYRMSFKARGAAGAQARVFWYDNKYYYRAADGSLTNRHLYSTTDTYSLGPEWQTYSRTFYIPHDTNFVRWNVSGGFQMRVELLTAGQYYLDDVRLEELVPQYIFNFDGWQINGQVMRDAHNRFRCWSVGVYPSLSLSSGEGMHNGTALKSVLTQAELDASSSKSVMIYLYMPREIFQEVTPQPGSVYRVAFDARAGADGLNAYLWPYNTTYLYRDANGVVKSKPFVASPPATFVLSTNWQRFETTFALPEDASFVGWGNDVQHPDFKMSLKLDQAGTFWIDNLRFEEIFPTD